MQSEQKYNKYGDIRDFGEEKADWKGRLSNLLDNSPPHF